MKFDARTAHITRNAMEHNLPKVFTKKGFEAMRNSVFFDEEIPAFETIKKHGLVKRVRVEWVETIEGINANGEAYRKDIERYWYMVNDELIEVEAKELGWIAVFTSKSTGRKRKEFFMSEADLHFHSLVCDEWGEKMTDYYRGYEWEMVEG